MISINLLLCSYIYNMNETINNINIYSYQTKSNILSCSYIKY